MKAAVIKKPGLIAVEEVPVPKVGAGEVLLKVEACALCGTDQRVLSARSTLLCRSWATKSAAWPSQSGPALAA